MLALEEEAADPVQAAMGSSSRHLHNSTNPGYIRSRDPRVASTGKRDYTWDQEEVDFMKAQGYLGKEFHKKRDDFMMYVEANAKMHLSGGH